MVKMVEIDEIKLRELYNDGISVLQISHILNVARTTVVRRLKHLGLQPRTGTQANIIRFGKMTEQERKNLTKACHVKLRGHKYTQEQLINLAKKRSSKSCNAGFFEYELALILMELGYKVEIQKQCGKYQIDIVVNDKYAIEIGKGQSKSVFLSSNEINTEKLYTIFDNRYNLIHISFSNIAAVILGFSNILSLLEQEFNLDNNVLIAIDYIQIKGFVMGKGISIKHSLIDKNMNELITTIQKITLISGKDRDGKSIYCEG